MTKVLYIAGWGRSGTTIVDNLLNSYPGVFSTGEIVYVWRRGLTQGRRCGCRERFPECALWRRVLTAAYGADRPDPRYVLDLQRRVARVRDTPRLARAPLPPEAREYADIMGRLYQAVGEVTGARLIVDSSKLPSGAALLPHMAGVEPYLLHMVRDPRGVAHSWMRLTPQPDRTTPALMDRHSPTASTAKWVVWNQLVAQVARSYPGRYRRLRYEDFAADPQSSLEELLAFAGVPSADGPFLDRHRAVLDANHTVSGNPGRFRLGEVELGIDDAWLRQQRLRPRLVVTTLALPLLLKYGYPLVPQPRSGESAAGAARRPNARHI